MVTMSGPVLAVIISLCSGGATKAEDAKHMLVYIGTYTSRGSEGIYAFDLDMSSGKLSPVGVTGGIKNPSFLAIHPNGTRLYAVSEVATMDGKNGGGLTAFEIDPATGALTMLNQESSGGSTPCHVSVDHSGKMAMIANYGDGNIGSFPLSADGKLMPLASFIQHEGKGPNKARQESAHAHSINPDPTNHYAMAADLGVDKVFVYKIDPSKGTLTPNDPPSATVPAGGGPRHFAFHPSGKFAYTNNELNSSVTAFTYDSAKGILKPIQTVTTLPAGYSGDENTTAEVQAHPNGKFLYVSNRGHNSIAGFSIDPETGKLTPIGHTSSGGEIPRNFGIDPTGMYLLAANQDTGNVVVFRVDPETGSLTPTGSEVAAPMAVCVKFLPRSK